MTGLSAWAAVECFLAAEALHLDRREWDDWIGLYDPEVEFWVPTYDDFGELIDDPKAGISHIYYPSRAGLEERVHRLRSRKSAASVPMVRTAHFFQLLKVIATENTLTVHTNWRVDCYRLDEATTNFGWATYELQGELHELRIKRKKIALLNDVIDSVVDVHMI